MMRGNKNYLNNNVKSGKQPDQKPIQGSNKFLENNFQQKLLTTTTDSLNTNIVNIKDAEKVAIREENY